MDDNIVRANTVRANLAGAGISVDEADRTQILDNTVTGNENGVVVSGFADDTRISGNTLSANDTVGITTQGSGTRIVGNKLNENGGAGILAGGNNTKIKDNQLNFNGYDQGLNNNSILGAISGGRHHREREHREGERRIREHPVLPGHLRGRIDGASHADDVRAERHG